MRVLRFVLPLLVSLFAFSFLRAVTVGSVRNEDNNPRIRRPAIFDNQQINPPPDSNRNKDHQTKMLIVDTDLAFWGDEGMALCMLLRSPSVKLLGVTSSSGNVWTEQASVNLLRFFEVIDHPEIPVHRGEPSRAHADRLSYYNNVEKYNWAKGVYSGALGQGTDLPPTIQEPPGGLPKLSLAKPRAVDFIIEQAHKFPGQVTLLVFGPSTNLAAAIRREPRLAKELGEVFVFGGAIHVPGNTTKKAEFNFWFDPESANAVLKEGLPLTLVPLDATDGKVFDNQMSAFFATGRTPMEKYLNQYFENRLKRRGGRPIPIWNEALAGLLLDPSIILSARQESIRVVLEHGADYGVSRASLPKTTAHEKPVRVVYRVDTDALQNMIYQLFR